MAAGLLRAEDATGNLNLGAMIAGKVKNAFAMSAEERKAREEEIKALEAKEELTDEEEQRLKFLQDQDAERKQPGLKGIKNSFLAKAMATEFGGDRLRRTKGTFSKDPDATQDPSLTKEQRFSALLDKAARPAGPPVSPEDDIRPEEYGDAVYQSPTPQATGLEKLLDTIKSQYSTISAKIGSLGSEEKKSVGVQAENVSQLSRITGVLESIKSYFNKDNDLKAVENQIEKDKVDMELESQADSKASAEQAAMSEQGDAAGVDDTDTLEEQKERNEGDDNGGGLLGNIFGGLKGMLGKFMGGKKGGGPKGATQYTKPIGPQPMNSPTPWASKGAGDRGGMFGSGGFTPRMPSAPTTPTPIPPTKMSEGGTVAPAADSTINVKSAGNSKPTKLAAGGVVDNPTRVNLKPGSSVIPLNRNNGLGRMFKSAGSAIPGGKQADPMAKVMQLPTQVGGGLLLSLLSDMMDKLGGMSSFLRGPIKAIATPIAGMFGLPGTIVNGLLGGPAAAGEMPGAGGGEEDTSFLGKLKSLLGKRGGRKTASSSGGPVTPFSGTETQYQLGGGAQRITSDMFGSRGFRTRDGVGSGATAFGHTGRDVGMPHGTPLSLAMGGKVIESDTGRNGGYGNFMVIKMADGRYIKSNHHSQNLLPEGADVVPGQPFAKVGNTGLSFGSHMHLDVGTGPYHSGPAKLDGLMDPDPFILSGGIFRGAGTATAEGSSSSPTPPAAPATAPTTPRASAPTSTQQPVASNRPPTPKGTQLASLSSRPSTTSAGGLSSTLSSKDPTSIDMLYWSTV